MHDHAPKDFTRAFAIGISLNVLFVLIEAGVGIAIGSLALVADAAHNLSDVISLLLAWGADLLMRRAPTPRRTYGYRKVSILAALASAILLLLAMGGIAWEAVQRFQEPQAISGWTVIIVAAIGTVINGITAVLFLSGSKEDLNIRGAFLHMVADAGISLGVVLGGAMVLLTHQQWIDPALSLLIAAVVTIGTWSLLRDSVSMAIDAVPRDIDPDEVRGHLLQIEGVEAIHDLHIWAMSTRDTALTVHLVLPDRETDDAFLREVAQGLHDRFHIEHSTIQIEKNPHDCSLSSDQKV